MARSLIPRTVRRSVERSKPAPEQAASRTREAELGQALGAPLLQARKVGDVELSAAPLEIAHGLGRVPEGWQLVDPDVAAMVWRTSKTAESITLAASASVRGALWVW